MSKRRENSGRRNGSPTRSQGNAKKSRLALEASEVEVLLKACRKYRATIPIYLQNVQPELLTVDQVIRKLSLEQE
jgi:hypothetical protein